MKKTIATTIAALLLASVSIGGITAPAAAAPYMTMHPVHPIVVHHPRHWHQHIVCKTSWHHHKKVKLCVWVPNHR